MNIVNYLRRQAKNHFKDFKEKAQKRFSGDAEYIVTYEYGYDENNFSLMKAQHIIAHMCAFQNWANLTKASKIELKVVTILNSSSKY